MASAERPPSRPPDPDSTRKRPCSRQGQGVGTAEHCCSENLHLQGPGASGNRLQLAGSPDHSPHLLCSPQPGMRIPHRWGPPSPPLPPACLLYGQQRGGHGVPVGSAGPWAVPRSAGASKPAPDARSLPPGRWPQLPRPCRCPAARQPGLVWSRRGDASQGVTWPRAQRPRRQALPGAQCPAAQAQVSVRPGPGVVTDPACHCPGRPVSHSCWRGLASQGHNPHPLKSLATCQGPPTGYHSLSTGRHDPARVRREVGADTTAWPDAAPHPPAPPSRPSPHGPARDGRGPLSPGGLSTGEWSVSNFGLRPCCQSPLSHYSSLPDSP